MVMEIAQDKLNPSTFYLLLVPKTEIGGTNNNGASVDGVGITTTTQTDPTFNETAANLATIVQITETLNNFTDSAQGGQ